MVTRRPYYDPPHRLASAAPHEWPSILAEHPDPNPLRYCGECEQRRRGSKADPTRCSHCGGTL